MGDSGPAVGKLQADLFAAGYGYAMGGYRQGSFDGPTFNAVASFQRNHPGTAHADGYGVYGPATNAALQNAIRGVSGG
jgi:hypothetical protein